MKNLHLIEIGIDGNIYENTSNSLFHESGFRHTGLVNHPEGGQVREWKLPLIIQGMKVKAHRSI
jgi:hypothetical protein